MIDMERHCSFCKSLIEENAVYCPNCGSFVEEINKKDNIVEKNIEFELNLDNFVEQWNRHLEEEQFMRQMQNIKIENIFEKHSRWKRRKSVLS